MAVCKGMVGAWCVVRGACACAYVYACPWACASYITYLSTMHGFGSCCIAGEIDRYLALTLVLVMCGKGIDVVARGVELLVLEHACCRDPH